MGWGLSIQNNTIIELSSSKRAQILLEIDKISPSRPWWLSEALPCWKLDIVFGPMLNLYWTCYAVSNVKKSISNIDIRHSSQQSKSTAFWHSIPEHNLVIFYNVTKLTSYLEKIYLYPSNRCRIDVVWFLTFDSPHRSPGNILRRFWSKPKP